MPLKKELGVEWRLDRTHCTEYTEEQLRREIAESGLVLEEMIVRWGGVLVPVQGKSTRRAQVKPTYEAERRVEGQ